MGGLVGQLQVSGLADRGEFGGDLLCGLPDLAALGLGERPSPAGAQAGQVRLLGVQVLGQDDLLPLVLQERRGEGQPGVGGSLRPEAAQYPLVRDDGSAAGLLDDAVGQPVNVEHLDPAAHVGVPDQQVKLGVEGFGQVAVEGGQQYLLGIRSRLTQLAGSPRARLLRVASRRARLGKPHGAER